MFQHFHDVVHAICHNGSLDASESFRSSRKEFVSTLDFSAEKIRYTVVSTNPLIYGVRFPRESRENGGTQDEGRS